MKKFLFFAMFTLPVILTGCRKDNNGPPNPSAAPALSLNKSSLTLFLGYADTLQVTGTQSSTSITWATSNDSVATVTNGVILAVGRGTATITAKILGGSNTASCNVSVNDMSNVIGVSNELILLNDSTERVNAGVGNLSLYNMVINRVALYSTQNVLITDRTLSNDSIITIPAQTLVITKTYYIGTGNLHVFEPGDNTGVVPWKSVLYFSYNGKLYKVSSINENLSFTVQ